MIRLPGDPDWLAAHLDGLARRLHAAWESHRLGLKGVDRTLKQYEHLESVGPYWEALARLVDRDARRSADRIMDKLWKDRADESRPKLVK